MLTTKDVKAAMRKPWWDLVKNEVARAIVLRTKTDDPSLKPHGSVLGQMFVDAMNELPELRGYVHYLITRKWPEIVSDVEGDLSAPMLDVFNHEESSRWFSEFQRFVLAAWKSSVPGKEPVDVAAVFDQASIEAIRKEWLLHLKGERNPALLAGVMLEWMRDDENPRLRKAAITACAFMAVRTWRETLQALRERFKSVDFSGLDTSEAAEFYERFRTMIQLPVEEYWDRLMKDAGIEGGDRRGEERP